MWKVKKRRWGRVVADEPPPSNPVVATTPLPLTLELALPSPPSDGGLARGRVGSPAVFCCRPARLCGFLGSFTCCSSPLLPPLDVRAPWHLRDLSVPHGTLGTRCVPPSSFVAGANQRSRPVFAMLPPRSFRYWKMARAPNGSRVRGRPCHSLGRAALLRRRRRLAGGSLGGGCLGPSRDVR